MRLPNFSAGDLALYKIALENGVKGYKTNTPPGSPVQDDCYIIGSSPTGAWAGNGNKVAVYDSAAWAFIPTSGAIGTNQRNMVLPENAGSKTYRWFGSEWIEYAAPTRLVDHSYTVDPFPQYAMRHEAGGTGSAAWGDITGTLSNQTDLQSALDGKAASSHNHAASAITSGTIDTARLGSGTANSSSYLRGDQTWSTIAGGGDVTGPASSVDNEIALFSSTTGKVIKRASTTGILKASSGVIAAAVSGTDYAPATTGSSVLKASSGGFANAVDGTDIYSSAYAIPNENIPNGINNASRASQSQTVVSGTAYYITRSNLLLPASSKTGGGMVVGTCFRWRVCLTKTAAGTGTFQIRIYRGTNGSTADTADVTQTLGTQTAAVDMMALDVMVVVTTTGATGAYYWTMTPMTKAQSATGFGVATGTSGFFDGTVSSVALNTASLQFGLGFISTTGTPTIRIPFVHGQVFNMT